MLLPLSGLVLASLSTNLSEGGPGTGDSLRRLSGTGIQVKLGLKMFDMLILKEHLGKKKEIKGIQIGKEVKFLTDDAILYTENSKEFMHTCTYTNPV